MVFETKKKVLTLETINKNIINVEYAVRGEIALRAEEIKRDLERREGNYNFDKLINCSIGNPQALGQQPITFFRQVMSLLEYPELIQKNDEFNLFPKDAIERAKLLHSKITSLGSYSHSQGIPYIRERVAEFIKERDGYPSNPNNIFLTTGASSGVQLLLQLLAQNDQVGVMIPIPQYPLYTATLSLNNIHPVYYYLNEEEKWGLNIEELKQNLKIAKEKNIDVRSLVIINPGNPTGQCLELKNMKQVIEFCYENNLILMADEVYQTNIYQPDEFPFYSFKKVLYSMDSKYHDLELVSFHSISKGMIGECGRRGGYFELNGIDSKVAEQVYKISSVSLCPNVSGQVMVDLMLNPPKKGDESYILYHQEIQNIYESLKRRSIKLYNAFNSMNSVSCNLAQGAMYLFPTIKLPQKAIDEAKKQGKQGDEFYCMEMLNRIGVCTIPGSGFKQKEATLHFRTTFLPSEDSIDQFINLLTGFHNQFMEEYS